MGKRNKKNKRSRKKRALTHKRTSTQSSVAEAMELARSGQLGQARDLCCKLLDSNPNSADAWHVLGMTLHLAHETEHAIQAFEKSISLDGTNAAVFSNLGVAHVRHGNKKAAAESYRQAIRLQPGLAEANNNLANVLKDLGQVAEAENYYREALRLKPGFTSALSNLGSVLEKQGQLDEAETCYRRALQLEPRNVSTLNNMGSTLARQERNHEAIEYYRRALQLQPDVATTYSNLAFVFAKLGHFSDVMNLLATAKQLDPAYASNYLFMLSKDPEASAENIFTEHRRWGETVEQTITPQSHERPCDPHRRLRIGYVSPDFRKHVVAKYIEPVLASHDPSEVEIFGYAEVAVPDAVTKRLQGLVHHWRTTCGLNAAQIADLVSDDQIDILVDLAGHTANNRLAVFAHKPAPVQVAWMGYPNTTGLRTIDYRITCGFQDPDEEAQWHTEQLVRLPGGSACFVPPEAAPPVGPLPAAKNGYITFGSLHRLDKLTTATFDQWTRILAAVPDSKLLVFWPTLHGARKEWLLEEFAERKIPQDRLDLRHEAGEFGYLDVYNEIDIGLDPIPWTGSTTTKEALWMGVAVLALYGARRSSRGSAVVLHQVGMDDLIASSLDEYVALATGLAKNLDRLAEIRAGLRNRMQQRLRDPKTFTRGLESAFRAMWREHCAA